MLVIFHTLWCSDNKKITLSYKVGRLKLTLYMFNGEHDKKVDQYDVFVYHHTSDMFSWC